MTCEMIMAIALLDEDFVPLSESDDDDDFSFSTEFSGRIKRETCSRCRRPITVCLCVHFPVEPYKIDTRVIILQHKDEIRRNLATVPLLVECLDNDKVSVYRAGGKRVNPSNQRHIVLSKALQCPDTVLLFPGKSAVDFKTLPRQPIGKDNDAAIIVLDGTWAQAKSMLHQNSYLSQVKQVSLSSDVVSEYVIRTQPTTKSLSTLESVAHMLSWVENKPGIVEVLVKPLRALCQYQLDHGAVVHVSKEDPAYIPREQIIKQKKEMMNNKSGQGDNT